MSGSIQDLDRIFADHFRVNPLIATNTAAAAVAKKSASRENTRHSHSSFQSGTESDEAVTPTFPPCIDLPVASTLNDPIRALKLKELYNNIAELYIEKQQSKADGTAPELESLEDAITIGFRSRQASARTITAPFENAVESIYPEDERSNNEVPMLSPGSSTGFRFSHIEASSSTPIEGDERVYRLRGRKSESALGLHNRSSTLKSECSVPSRDNGKQAVRDESPPPAPRELSPSPAPSFPQSVEEADEKRVLLPLEEIIFNVSKIPDNGISESDAKNLLSKTFPHLCEVPTRMVGENGELLPPTKKEETTPEERLARKEALVLHFRGTKLHSLIKSVVILESRSAVWKRVGSAKGTDTASRPLPSIPDPWGLECYHQDLDKLAQDGKAKRAFELKDSRIEGLCTTCHGKGLSTCSTCKGEEADECWWCSGTGKKKNLRDCERCVGEGKLKCQACSGKLLRSCEPCKGEGHGLYAAMVNIKVRRVAFPPVPTSMVVLGGNHQDPELVRGAAVERTKEMIDRLISTSEAKGRTSFRPLTASCSWEVSNSTLVEVEVCQSMKLLTRKPTMHIGLRRQLSTNSIAKHSKKSPTSTRFFMLPSDNDLKVVELSKEEFGEALLPELSLQSLRHRSLERPIERTVESRASTEAPKSNVIRGPGGAMMPMPQAFRFHAAPSIGLSSTATTPCMTPDHEPSSYFDAAPSRPTRSELRTHHRAASTPRKPPAFTLHPPGQRVGAHF